VEANASDPLAETAKQAPAHPWGLVETPARPILVEANASTATGGATRSRKRQNKRQHIRGDSWKRQHAHDHERNVQIIKDESQQETLQTSSNAELVSPIPSSNIPAEALQFSYVSAVQHLVN
jgi:hypothetical protein